MQIRPSRSTPDRSFSAMTTQRPLKLYRLLTSILVVGLAVLSLPAYALVGVDWALRNLTPTNESFNAIARNGDAGMNNNPTNLVAVGSRGLIVTATAAAGPWTVRTSGTQENLNSVTWSGSGDSGVSSPISKFVVVGNNGTVLVSTDLGATWTSIADSTMKGIDFVSVFWTSSKFVIAGNGPTGPVVYTTTPEAVVWTKLPALTGTGLKAVSVTGSLSSTVTVLTNKDIQNHNASVITGAWTVTSFPSGETACQTLLFNNPTYFLSGSTAYSTTTLGSWVPHSTLTDAGLNLTLNFSPTGTKFYAAGPNGAVWWSTAGTTWSSLGQAEAGVQIHGAVNFGSDVVAVGDAGRIYRYSGSAWTSVYSTGVADSLTAVTSKGSTVVALGKNAVLTSPDGGNTWSRSAAIINAASVVSINGGGFVAVGDHIYNSNDGASWVIDSSVAYVGRLNRLASVGGSNLLAVGADTSGLVLASLVYKFDGTSWSKVTLPAGCVKELRGAASSPTLTLAVGDGGTVLTNASTGTVWVKRSVVLAAGENFTDVLFNGSQFVASTSLGGVWTSIDGITWTKRQASAKGGLSRLVRASSGANNVMVGVGGVGSTTRSFGGTYWFASNLGTNQNLTDMVWTGLQLVAVGSNGTIYTSGGGVPARPLVKFTVDKSTVLESAGTVQVAVQISPPSPLPVTVTFAGSTSHVGDVAIATLGTTATSDYSLPTPTVLTFPANLTGTQATTDTQNIAVTVRQDYIDEPDETATLTLSAPTGDAALDSPFQYVLTIQDDDVQPYFTAPPLNQLVYAGSSLTLSATGAGFPMPTGVWKKNGTTITGATASNTLNSGANPLTTTFNSSYSGSTLTTAQAGAYTLLLTNLVKPAGVLSVVGQVGVVDNTSKVLVVAEKGVAVLTVKAAGNGLSYRWQRGNPLGSPTLLDDDTSPAKHISGAKLPTLTIKGIGMGETDTYSCVVTQVYTSGMPIGTQSKIGGQTTVTVINAKPVVTLPVLPTVNPVVGEFVSLTPSATNLPSKWTVTGLPPGLAIDPVTGVVSGRALKSGLFHVTYTATNLLGSTSSSVQSLNISDLPDGIVGTYMAVGKINSALDNLLGTRLDLTISDTSTYSGKLTHGSTSTSFTGALSYVAGTGGATANAHVTGSVAVNAAGFAPVILSFTVYNTDSTIGVPNSLDARINDTATGLLGVALSGWRFNTWNTVLPAGSGSTNVTGQYNFAFNLIGNGSSGSGSGTGSGFNDDLTLPQGYGAGTFTVGTDGSFQLTGKMGDTTAFTSSGFLKSVGSTPGDLGVPVFAGLYSTTATKGVVDGMMTLTLNQDSTPNYEFNTLTGKNSIQWTKSPLPAGAAKTGRLYTGGFADNLNLGRVMNLGVLVPSGKYTPPHPGEVVMDIGTQPTSVDNLQMYIHDGGVFLDDFTVNPTAHNIQVALNPEVYFTVDAPAVIGAIPNNPANTYLSFDVNKGTFAGGFVLVDPDIPSTKPPVRRAVTFDGFIIGHRQATSPGSYMRAFGSFSLPLMPYAGNYDLAGGIQLYRRR